MSDNKKFSPHLLSSQTLIEKLNSSAHKGISGREAFRRLRRYGYNQLQEESSSGPILIFLSQFNDFMMLVLITATLLSLIMGEMTDAVTIFAIIILNSCLGFFQEYRAEKSLSKLKKTASPGARVKREGEIRKIDACELVPGDIIIIKTGDKVPADARIIEADNLKVDQSLLTGESKPSPKNNENLYAKNIEPADQTNMLFMGTTIISGRGTAIVARTGSSTEMGKIADLLNKKNRKLTPLQKRLKSLGKWLVFFSLLFTVLIVIIGVYKGQSIYQMLLAGISLAVAAIPEGLPAIVTLALAFGVQKMIKKNAIVRKLPAVETLGCATVICADKTGTLTKNKMELTKIMYNNQIFNFSNAQKTEDLEKLLKIGALCNMSQPRKELKTNTLQKVKKIITGKKAPPLYGNPTDKALIKAIYKKDLSLEDIYKDYKVLNMREFTSQAKSMSIIIENKHNKRELWSKGAPETIINKCQYNYNNGQKVKLNQKTRKEIIKVAESMAGNALRVLALCFRTLPSKRNIDIEKYENNLVFMGLVGLMDTPRPEIYKAVKVCHRAGIKPVMITGDHALTARVIAKEIGIIERYDQVITGDELNKMTEKQQKYLIKNRRVFARIKPADKLKIVKTLQESGEVVAMTGDGINDAPAIKQADIGIAMGKKGTDVTRETASLILADDNFTTIVCAVREGRKIYNNIRKFIKYLLSCNTGELLTIFLGITLGLPLPLLPIHILWVNLVTDGLPALALSMEDENKGVMEVNPRSPRESIFEGMKLKIICQGILIGVSTIFAFLIGIYYMGVDINTARTLAFSTLVFSQLIYVFSCRTDEFTLSQFNIMKNIYLFFAVLFSTILQLTVIYHPFLSHFFTTTPLPGAYWLIIIFLAVCPTLILEILQIH